MKEDFLHFLWRTRRFAFENLTTTRGVPLEVLHVGTHNLHSGPDFSNARIRIGDTLWAGNIEIHIKASEWYQHRHQDDPAYANVILHVVLEEDQPVQRPGFEDYIPCLELHSRLPARALKMYHSLQQSKQWIPCQHFFHTTKAITRDLWIDRLMVERLEEKTQDMHRALQALKQDWEALFFRFLARNFGLKVNAEPFDQLARATPWKLLQQYRNRRVLLEALLFGQAGMLGRDFKDSYPQQLQREYAHLQKKHQLKPIPVTSWRFMRLRPANFPTIRIAQLAQLIFQSNHLFSKLLAVQRIKEVENMFAVSLSNYWKTHYVFDKSAKAHPKSLGTSAIHLLVINTIAPLLFFYGKERDEPKHRETALRLLEALPAESNAILGQWESLGLKPESAYQSQGLLQLKNRYCEQKRCLECAIGHDILQP